jgi:RNA polymerase sigma-70 factor (ECF subfamily)
MIKHPDDKEILDLFKQGASFSERAFNHVSRKYGKQIYWQIRRITKNHDDTNDILQNVFVKIWLNLGGFNEKSTLYSWIYRIARNETITFLEKSKRNSSVDIDDSVIEVMAGHSTLDSHSADEISELLMMAIETLPEKQSQVFQLKYFEDLKYSEISLQVGTSEGALKANYFHAVQKIQDFILSKLNH